MAGEELTIELTDEDLGVIDASWIKFCEENNTEEKLKNWFELKANQFKKSQARP